MAAGKPSPYRCSISSRFGLRWGAFQAGPTIAQLTRLNSSHSQTFPSDLRSSSCPRSRRLTSSRRRFISLASAVALAPDWARIRSAVVLIIWIIRLRDSSCAILSRIGNAGAAKAPRSGNARSAANRASRSSDFERSKQRFHNLLALLVG